MPVEFLTAKHRASYDRYAKEPTTDQYRAVFAGRWDYLELKLSEYLECILVILYFSLFISQVPLQFVNILL